MHMVVKTSTNFYGFPLHMNIQSSIRPLIHFNPEKKKWSNSVSVR